MKTLVREPLLHFLLIGAALFVIYGRANRTEPGQSDRTIVVSAGRLEHLAAVFEKTRQRPPSPAEMRDLVDDFVLEEAYYRQAVAMGIDRDDTIIRRRLRQKLEFLTSDLMSPAAPTDEDLAAYFAAHGDKFRVESTYTFQHFYFNPEQIDGDVSAFVAGQLRVAQSGRVPAGHASLLPDSFDRASRREVDGVFGAEFSRQLDQLAIGEWQGPVASAFGVHLVRVDARTDGRLPSIDEARPAVEREWMAETSTAARAEMSRRMLEGYEVIVEWSEQDSSRAQSGGED